MPKHRLTRRDLIKTAGLAALGLSLPFDNQAPASAQSELTLYVGTYTRGKSEGIYIYRMNPVSGELKRQGTAGGVANPSYLAIDRRRGFLYAVNEVGEYAGKRSGAVTAFAIDQKTGELSRLNQRASQGADPCYLTIDPTGKFLLTANYTGGNIAVLPIAQDGSLGEAVDLVQHRGSGANPGRQEGPHAHCIELDRTGRFAYAVDLGIDKVMIYRFDPKTGKLLPNSPPFAQAKAGAGPRHIDFHPNGKFAYLINELGSTLTAFAYNKSNGALKDRQTVSTLPAGFAGNNSCADIHVHPSGRFVYGSNRGHDSIVAFAIDQRTGKLEYLAHESTRGKTPRNFVIDPTGGFLLAANQNSDTVVVFRIDQKNGKIAPAGMAAQIPAPVCLKFN